MSFSSVAQDEDFKGVPFTTIYNSDNYEYHGQTWATVKTAHGDMLVAHDKGILVFDGHNWELLELPNKSTAFTIKSFDERVYVGGYHEMGYLKTDAKGAYQYVSLMPEDSFQQTVWDIAYSDSIVYYRTSKGLVMHNFATDQSLVKNDSRYTRLLEMNGEWYAMFYPDGIFKLNPELFINDSAKPFHALKDHMFYFALPYEGTVSLVYDFAKGFMLYNLSNKQLIKWENSFEKSEGRPYIYAASQLKNGQYVFSVPRKGVFLIDRRGKITDVFNRSNAFRDNYIINIYEDKRGNLWLNTNNNVLFMEFNSPFRKIDNKYHLPGFYEFSHIFRDSLFVGTTSGLYSMAINDLNRASARFHPVMKDLMFLNLFTSGNGFFMSTIDSLIHYPSKTGVLPYAVNSMFSPGYDSTLIFAGSEQGIMKLRWRNGGWRARDLKGFNGDVLKLVSTESGNIWIERSFKGIWNLRLSPEKDSVTEKKPLSSMEGFTDESLYSLFELDGKPVIAGTQGYFEWNQQEQKFVPIDVYNDYIPKSRLDFLTKNSEGELWFWKNGIESFGGVLREIGEGVIFDTTRFRRLEHEMVTNIDFHERHTLFTTSDKLVFYHPEKDILKKDLTASVSDIYDFMADTLIRKNPLHFHEDVLLLSPQRNNLRFHARSDMFIRTESARYSFLLEGYNAEWAPWQKAPFKEYSDLPPGEYILRVKMKDHHEHISESKGYRFEITTPWYLTRIAIGIYVVALIILFFVIFEWMKVYNRQERIKLEEKIKIRTKELIREKDALRKERDKVDEMNVTKDRFFSIIAHDLRSPFNSLLGLTEVLKQDFDFLDDEEKKEIIENLNKTANQSFSLLDNLLVWSRSQRNSVDLYPGFYDINGVVNETLSLLESTIRSKKITVQNNLEFECIGYFDKNMVLTIVRNLVSNAVKFTDEQGLLELSADEDESNIRLHVKDNGIGISDIDLENLFDTGKQTRRKGTHNEAGTGLGLILCKDFVEKNNGSLHVKSELKKGSIFTLTLPKHPDA